MNDEELQDLFEKQKAAALRDSAKQAAMQAAMAEFRAAKAEASAAVSTEDKKSADIFQGILSWLRPKGDSNLNDEDSSMKNTPRTWMYGGFATAMVAVIAVVSIDFDANRYEPGATYEIDVSDGVDLGKQGASTPSPADRSVALKLGAEDPAAESRENTELVSSQSLGLANDSNVKFDEAPSVREEVAEIERPLPTREAAIKKPQDKAQALAKQKNIEAPAIEGVGASSPEELRPALLKSDDARRSATQDASSGSSVQEEQVIVKGISASPVQQSPQPQELEEELLVTGLRAAAPEKKHGHGKLNRALRSKKEFAAQAAKPMAPPHPDREIRILPKDQEHRDSFESFDINPVLLTSEQPVSTFSADVDTASYSFVRRSLTSGRLPPKNAVRIEEMLNYFDYDYSVPKSKQQPFEPNVYVMDSPWAEGKKLVHIGIKGYELQENSKPRSHLTFLLDVSGSMNSPDKLPLVKQSMGMLLSSLDDDDTVAIVVYAGAAGTVLEPTKVKDKQRILEAMNRLQAGGSTAGAAGIERAYQLAESTFDKKAVNRIILATDGDFNVGINNEDELKGYVERKREKGIFLTILGFGQGNYQDKLMQALAQNGNGTAAYIDTLSEAQKVLVNEAGATLFPIAKDVKLQVEFNPAMVSEYRLIGYETRALKREDFNNDKVDAAELGAGHTVTAIYEITPSNSGARSVDDLRYSEEKVERKASSNEYGFLKIRYKLPKESKSRLIEKAISVDNDRNVGRAKMRTIAREANFASSVVGFAQLLKNPKYLGDWSFGDAIKLANANKGEDEFGYRSEFVQLIRKAEIAQKM